MMTLVTLVFIFLFNISSLYFFTNACQKQLFPFLEKKRKNSSGRGTNVFCLFLLCIAADSLKTFFIRDSIATTGIKLEPTSNSIYTLVKLHQSPHFSLPVYTIVVIVHYWYCRDCICNSVFYNKRNPPKNYIWCQSKLLL